MGQGEIAWNRAVWEGMDTFGIAQGLDMEFDGMWWDAHALGRRVQHPTAGSGLAVAWGWDADALQASCTDSDCKVLSWIEMGCNRRHGWGSREHEY
jgi:hypothetical protein